MRTLLLASLPLISLGTVQGVEHTPTVWSGNLAGGLLSQYVSEGRDQLGAGGLAWSAASLGWHGLELGASAARGTQVDYTEYNLWLGYTYSWEPLTLSGSATQLWFPEDSSDDQELGLSASYAFWGPLQVDGGVTYGFVAEGTFVTLGLSCPIACGTDDSATITPFIVQAFDLGYASADYDGPNNLEFGVAFSQKLGAGLFLEACGHYSCAQHDITRASGGNEAWVSLGLLWAH